MSLAGGERAALPADPAGRGEEGEGGPGGGDQGGHLRHDRQLPGGHGAGQIHQRGGAVPVPAGPAIRPVQPEGPGHPAHAGGAAGESAGKSPEERTLWYCVWYEAISQGVEGMGE